MLRAYSNLLPYLKRYKTNYILGLFSLILTSGGQLFIPQFIREMVDTISTGNFLMEEIYRPLLLMLSFAILIALGRLGWRFWLHGAARRIETELRDDLFNHLTLLGDQYYQEQKIGDILARATNDLHQVRMASSMGLVAFFDGLFMSIAILVILFQQNSSLAIFTIIPLPLITILVLGLGRLIGSLFRGVQESFSRLSEQSQEVFTNMRLIQSFVKEKYFINRFADANDNYQEQNLKLIQVWGFLFPVVAFLSGLTTLILLFAGGKQVIAGTLSPGEFVATLSYLQMLIWPMLGAGFTVNILQRGGASLKRIFEIMHSPTEFTQESSLNLPCWPIKSSISLNGVSVSYGMIPVLKEIHTRFQSGEITGIIGPTGSGKTTLIRLLLRLIEPGTGELLYDEVPYKKIDPHSLRQQFGYVAQDGFLFSDSIINNIGFSLGSINQSSLEERVIPMIKAAGIEKDIEQFPEGIETQIGERGISVSGGQKQRIAIARGLIKNPEILVLDDSLSAIDAHTEEAILNSIIEMRRGKTTIIVSHRVSSLRISDTILVLENGRISQTGTHHELQNESGYYRDIYLLQQAEEVEENK